jgi:hypothetical protein
VSFCIARYDKFGDDFWKIKIKEDILARIYDFFLKKKTPMKAPSIMAHYNLTYTIHLNLKVM